jgi:hypothetical protein
MRDYRMYGPEGLAKRLIKAITERAMRADQGAMGIEAPRSREGGRAENRAEAPEGTERL